MALNSSALVCWRCSMRASSQTPARALRLAITSQYSSRNASTVTAPKLKSKTISASIDPANRKAVPVSPQSTTKSIAQEIRKIAPSLTETYVAYGVCEELVKECVRVADYTIPQAEDLKVEIPTNEAGEHVGVGDSWWYKKLGMTPTFNTWVQITFLHMYLITVRLRAFPPEHAPTWNQHLVDHFFQLAEDRMVLLHRFNSRMMRQKYLKEFHVQWRGLNATYDEGLMKGDAVLAAAVWRNICKGDENVDLERLAEIVSYMRSVLASFDSMPDSVLAQGDVVFGDPSSEEAVVKAPAALLSTSQTEAAKTSPKVVKK